MDGLRSIVKPITHNLPTPVRELAISLIGPQCYQQLLVDIDLSKHECIKLAASKAIGTGIVAVSGVVKLPQLYKLVKARSGDGLSLLSYLLETAGYLITLAYNARMGNPFSTYGEVVLIAAQNLAIISLLLNYSGRPGGAAGLVAALALALSLMFNRALVDDRTLALLQTGAGLLGVASKLPQIFTIWSQGTTGQLSSFAVFNFLFGSLSRIFTTLQEVNDPIILYGYLSGFVLNLVLALQVIYYWNTPVGAAGSTARKFKNPANADPQARKADTVGTSSLRADVQTPRAPSTRRRA